MTGGKGFSTAKGSSTKKEVPTFSLLVTETVPFIAFTKRFTIANPRPAPPFILLSIILFC